jgi:hypothetical protein
MRVRVGSPGTGFALRGVARFSNSRFRRRALRQLKKAWTITYPSRFDPGRQGCEGITKKCRRK